MPPVRVHPDLRFRQDNRLGSDFIVRIFGLGLGRFFQLSPFRIVCVFPFGSTRPSGFWKPAAWRWNQTIAVIVASMSFHSLVVYARSKGLSGFILASEAMNPLIASNGEYVLRIVLPCLIQLVSAGGLKA